MNAMRQIRINKVTINIGCDESGEKLEKAKKLLHGLTQRKVYITRTLRRSTFGVAKGRPIGCKVTLRGKQAEEFLEKAFDAIDKKLNSRIFDTQGNFSFGIKEHIDVPGVKYDPDIGIYGMDVCITLERKGFRVARKRIKNRISLNHRITPDEAREWAIKNFGVNVE